MTHVFQPRGSSLCGHACVAMAAGVSLDRAIEAVGHQRKRGTKTREVIAALRALGVGCADRLKRVSRSKPVLPARAIVVIHNPHTRPDRWHWMLMWDGQMYDPEGLWPEYYKDWRITSFLAIHS